MMHGHLNVKWICTDMPKDGLSTGRNV